MKHEIIGTKPINLYEVKETLEKIQKRDEELNFRAQKTMEYVQQVAKLGKEKAAELFKKIESLNVPRLKEQHINKIIDILPKTEEEVKVVMQGYNVTVSKENCKKIAEVVEGFEE
ncbi:MAG TPA: hypothetical protein ENF94_01775 [Candidatus Woesearchaeota archaeon]|nr:MAG: hypothetical protein DRJ25_01990 [Candidatus Woesearchaeota archaeon]HDD70870.1 hypothetical protein [Candidatus Woesearchaeota archaeon]